MAAGRGKLCPGISASRLGGGRAQGARGAVPLCRTQPSQHSLGGGRQPTEQLSAPSGGRTVASTVITDGL